MKSIACNKCPNDQNILTRTFLFLKHQNLPPGLFIASRLLMDYSLITGHLPCRCLSTSTVIKHCKSLSSRYLRQNKTRICWAADLVTCSLIKRSLNNEPYRHSYTLMLLSRMFVKYISLEILTEVSLAQSPEPTPL